MTLKVLPSIYVIAKLPADAEFLDRSGTAEFLSVTRTRDELSIVCEQSQAPQSAKVEADWRILKVEGTLDFGLTGILASIAAPLAQVKISIFTVSTFDTDYVLVKNAKVEAAVVALTAAGHTVVME